MPPDVPDVRVSIGPLVSIPEDACVAVADGRAIAFRVGDRVCVYRNQCLHQDSPLAGGIIRNGVLSCPLHFWRYRAESGHLIGTERRLDAYPVEIIGGDVFVWVPGEPPKRSLREQLLERARQYDRDEAWRSRYGPT